MTTVEQNVQTNELRQNERMEIGQPEPRGATRRSSASSSAAPRPRRRRSGRSTVAQARERTRPQRVSPRSEPSETSACITRTRRRSLVAERGQARARRGRRRRTASARSPSRPSASRRTATLEVIGREREVALRQHRQGQGGRDAEEGDRRRRPRAHRRRQDGRRRGGDDQGRPRHRRGRRTRGGARSSRAEGEAAGDGSSSTSRRPRPAEEVAEVRRAPEAITSPTRSSRPRTRWPGRRSVSPRARQAEAAAEGLAEVQREGGRRDRDREARTGGSCRPARKGNGRDERRTRAQQHRVGRHSYEDTSPSPRASRRRPPR